MPINENFIVPDARSLHSMAVINSKLYVFGGVDSDKVYNDMWTFDLIDNIWEPVSTKGEVPTPRYLCAADSEGDIFVIWGGESFSGLKDDMFIFNSVIGYWIKLTPTSSSKPSPAKGACLVLNNFKVYIYAGETDSGKSNELWEYDIGSNEFKLLSDSGLRKLTYHHCWLDSDLFYVSLGSTEYEESSPQIDFFNLSSKTWNIFHQHELDTYDSALSSQVFVDNHLISIGGERWFQENIKKISVFGSGNKTHMLDFELDFNSYASAYVYFNRSLIIFGGGCVLGYALLPKVGHTLLAKINVDDICIEIGCKAHCSVGTYEKSKICLPCKEGTYSDMQGISKCKECKPGTYNNKIAASTKFQCIPCPEGEYGSESAAKNCKICPNDTYCPIGSISPSEKLQNKTSHSSQPLLYEKPDLSDTYFLYRVFVGVPLLIGILCCLSIKFLRNKLEKIDIFDDKHDDDESDYMIKKQTKIGGVFSIIFIAGALLLTCTTILSYFKANIKETKGLVPLAILESEVSSFQSEQIILEVSLSSYGGHCEEDSECVSSINAELLNIECSDKRRSCKLLENNICNLKVVCRNGEIKTGAQLNINLMESSSYSSGIEVNLTSSSSIPNEDSSVSSFIISESRKVFIGSVASEFYFLATPSLFESESKNWPSQLTGFHVSERNSPLLGSQYSHEELPSVSNLNIRIFIETSSTALMTKRLLIQDLLFFAGALLGTVSGLFDIAGFVMSLFEQQFDKLIKKLRKSQENEVNNPGICAVNEVAVLNEDCTKLDIWKKVQSGDV